MSVADIEAFYKAHQQIYDYLLAKGEPTFASETNDNFRRSLILAIASSFEHEIAEIMRTLPELYANSHSYIGALIEKKVISRQYHTYFDWDKGANANSFFKMFGAEFAEFARAEVKADAELDKAVRDFLELGNARNRLVHLDYVTFDVDASPEDIIAKFRSAMKFIDFLVNTLLHSP